MNKTIVFFEKVMFNIRNSAYMSLSISKKLIFSFLELTLIVLVATLGLSRWSFEHVFLDYVNALEETRLQLLATSLSHKYQSSGNFW